MYRRHVFCCKCRQYSSVAKLKGDRHLVSQMVQHVTAVPYTSIILHLILGPLQTYPVSVYRCTQKTKSRVTTCLENLEVSGNLTAVREMSDFTKKSGKCRGKNSLSGKSCLKLFIVSCIFASIHHHHHQSELVGDIAVPVSVRQAVLF